MRGLLVIVLAACAATPARPAPPKPAYPQVPSYVIFLPRSGQPLTCTRDLRGNSICRVTE